MKPILKNYIDHRISRLLSAIIGLQFFGLHLVDAEPPFITEVEVEEGTVELTDNGIVYITKKNEVTYPFGDGVSQPFWNVFGSQMNKISPRDVDRTKGAKEIQEIEMSSLNGKYTILLKKNEKSKVYRVVIKTIEFPSGVQIWISRP